MLKKSTAINIFLICVLLLAACQPASTASPAGATANFTALPLNAATFTAQPIPTNTPQPTIMQTAAPAEIRFAVIGDFGSGDLNEASVAKMVHGWNPDIIITVGDNNYPLGAEDTIDAHLGQFYHDYIYPYSGQYGAGAAENRFFPTLGNHDWYTTGAQPYLDYLQLPGNERYYDFVRGPVHFFALDSDGNEPDGTDSNSKQAQWLKAGLAASVSTWNVVYFHYPPYSSGYHGSIGYMRWPFAAWGANVVLSGHDHSYERLSVDGIPYIVNGLGGGEIYDFNTPVAESIVRYNATYGAMLVTATPQQLTFAFYNHHNTLVDSFTETKN
jgi:hypothetical protein